SVPRVARIVDQEYRMFDLMASAQEFQSAESQNPVVSNLLQQANEETRRLRFPDEHRRQKLVSRLLWALFIALIVANLLAFLPWERILPARGPVNASENGMDDGTGRSENSEQPGNSGKNDEGESDTGSDGTQGENGSAGDAKNGEKKDGKCQDGTNGKPGENGSEGKNGNRGKSGEGTQNGKDGKPGESGNGKSGNGGQSKSSGNQGTQKALNAFGKGLQQNQTTQKLGQALAQNDFQKGAREAEKLAQQPDGKGDAPAQQRQSLAQAAQQALEREGQGADQATQQMLRQLANAGASEARRKEALRQMSQMLKKLAEQQKADANGGQQGTPPKTGAETQAQAKPGQSSGQSPQQQQGVGGTKAGGQLDEDPLQRMQKNRPSQPGDDRLVDPNEQRQVAASAAQRVGAFQGRPELTPEQQQQRQRVAEKAAQSRKVDEFAQYHRIPDEFRTYLKDFFTR
ncbi:MAG TPA: hypothetical protein PKO06_18790, partial [Candidatus Ozemobacteraceae bacterium]|nr:hypothetical protein [Candidatus Ozemobacteraceae bacterium]